MSEPVFTKVWLADGRIICYRFISTGEEAAGAWFSEVDDLFSNWDGSKPLLLLVDVSQCDNRLSSEALRIASNLSNIHPDLKGKTALVIESSKPAQNVYGVVRSRSSRHARTQNFQQRSRSGHLASSDLIELPPTIAPRTEA